MLLPPPFEDAVHTRIWEVLQGRGSVRTHTGDELGRAWSTTEGPMRVFGNEGGCTSQAPTSAGRVSPCRGTRQCAPCSAKWAAAVGQ